MTLGLEPSRIILDSERIIREYIEQGFVPRVYIEMHGFEWLPEGEKWQYDHERDGVKRRVD